MFELDETEFCSELFFSFMLLLALFVPLRILLKSLTLFLTKSWLLESVWSKLSGLRSFELSFWIKLFVLSGLVRL